MGKKGEGLVKKQVCGNYFGAGGRGWDDGEGVVVGDGGNAVIMERGENCSVPPTREALSRLSPFYLLSRRSTHNTILT